MARALPLALAAGVGAAFVLLAVESPGDRFGLPIAALTAGVWLVGTTVGVVWSRRRSADWLFGPAGLDGFSCFLLLASAVYTLFALQEADVELTLSPNQPDNVPGLIADPTFYYLAVHAGVTLLISLYGRINGRRLETAVAMLVVYASPLFEPVWRTDTGGPLLLGTALVVAAFTLTQGRENGVPDFRWTPFGLPVLALVAAGILATMTAAYVQHSLVLATKIASFAFLALLTMNVVREQRHIRLLWAAMVLPGVGMAILMLSKLVEIGNNMGVEFAVRHRFHFLGLVGANTLGLMIVVDILLVIGALFWVRRPWPRVAIALLLVPLVPALLSLRSSSALVALAAGLGIILMSAWSRQLLAAGRRLLNPLTVTGGLLAIGAIVAVVLIPNPYAEEWQDELSDPTTGRGVRTNVWKWSLEDIAHHPFLGIGLADRRFEPRTEQVPEFPFRGVTSLAERRLLLGGQGSQWRIYVWGHPHNLLLSVAETMGIVGVAALCWLLGSLGLCGLDLLRRPMTRERWVVTVSMAGVAAGLTWSLFALGQNVALLPLATWVLLGLLGGSYCMTRPTRALARAAPSRPIWGEHTWIRLRALLRPVWFPLASLALAIAFLGMVARPAVAETIAGQARAERQQGQLDEAIDRFKLARRLDPNNAPYLEELAQLHFRTGDLQEGTAALRQLVQAEPQSAANHTRLGWAYWLDNDLDAAVPEFERAVELDPWNALGSNNLVALALAYLSSGNRHEAISTFKQAILVEPGAVRDPAWVVAEGTDSSEPFLDPAYFTSQDGEGRLAGLLLRRLGVPTRATTAPLPPPSSSETLLLSEVLESAYVDYQSLPSSESQRAQGTLSAIARAYAAAGRAGRAAELLVELADLAPDETYVRYDLGLAYVALEQDANAAQAFEAVVRLAKQSNRYDIYEPFAHFQLGLAELRNGAHEAALQEFRATIDSYRWPYFPDAYYGLIEAASQSGHEEEAAATLRRLEFLLGTDAVRESEWMW